MIPCRRTARRHALARLGTLVLAAAAPAVGTTQPAAPGATPPPSLAPTPADAEGPFYPTRFPTDADHDLAQVAGRTAQARGTLLYLSGRVLTTGGAPLAGVRIELWQCDSLGRYHHVEGDPGERDEDFQGYGVATTDTDGRYAFRTIRPVRYGGRPPHLHFKLAHARARPLTTQLYPRGESAERGMGFGLSDPTMRSRLEFALEPATGRERGALAGRYDFVLRTT